MNYQQKIKIINLLRNAGSTEAGLKSALSWLQRQDQSKVFVSNATNQIKGRLQSGHFMSSTIRD